MSYNFEKEATYLNTLIQSQIIKLGAQWDKWLIGTTANPEKHDIVFEALNEKEAKITIDFLTDWRKLAVDNSSDSGKYVYLKKKQ